MSNPKCASEANVRDAYRQLLTDGEEPSVRKIRQITGGSHSDISPLVSKLNEERQRLESTPMPAELQHILCDFMGQFWIRAAELQQEVSSVDIRFLKEQLLLAESKSVALKTENEQLSSNIEHLKAKITTQQVQIEKIRSERDRLEGKLDVLQPTRSNSTDREHSQLIIPDDVLRRIT